jgi:hypothetical protein
LAAAETLPFVGDAPDDDPADAVGPKATNSGRSTCYGHASGLHLSNPSPQGLDPCTPDLGSVLANVEDLETVRPVSDDIDVKCVVRGDQRIVDADNHGMLGVNRGPVGRWQPALKWCETLGRHRDRVPALHQVHWL